MIHLHRSGRLRGRWGRRQRITHLSSKSAENQSKLCANRSIVVLKTSEKAKLDPKTRECPTRAQCASLTPLKNRKISKARRLVSPLTSKLSIPRPLSAETTTRLPRLLILKNSRRKSRRTIHLCLKTTVNPTKNRLLTPPLTPQWRRSWETNKRRLARYLLREGFISTHHIPRRKSATRRVNRCNRSTRGLCPT